MFVALVFVFPPGSNLYCIYVAVCAAGKERRDLSGRNDIYKGVPCWDQKGHLCVLCEPVQPNPQLTHTLRDTNTHMQLLLVPSQGNVSICSAVTSTSFLVNGVNSHCCVKRGTDNKCTCQPERWEGKHIIGV